MMKRNKWAAAGTLILALLLGLTGCSGTSSNSDDTVAVQSVAMIAGIGTFGIQDRYSGKVVSQATQQINKQEDRTVKELKVAVGDTVKKGDVLFTYDLDEIRLAIDMGKLELEKLQNSIESTNKQIQQLEQDQKKASKSDQLSYSIEIQSLQADVKESEYQLAAKTIEQEQLEKTLGNAEVTSTIDGVVQSINENGEPDEYGNASAYIVLMEVGNYRVQGEINEMNRAALSGMEGQSIIVRSRVNKDEIWRGKLDKVDTENPIQNNSDYYYGGDEGTQSTNYPFYVSLDNSDGLMMGQHVYIEMDQGQADVKTGIWIPSPFLVVSGEEAYAWAATSKDKLERRELTLGEFDADLDQYEVVEGLTAQDYIAIADEELKEGMPVTRYDEEFFEDYEDFMYEFGGEAAEDMEIEDGEEWPDEGESAWDMDMEDAGMAEDAEMVDEEGIGLEDDISWEDEEPEELDLGDEEPEELGPGEEDGEVPFVGVYEEESGMEEGAGNPRKNMGGDFSGIGMKDSDVMPGDMEALE